LRSTRGTSVASHPSYQGRDGSSPSIDLFEKGRPIDQLTLSAALKDRGAEQQVGGLGYLSEIVSAVNGQEALDMVQSESPDLILLDVAMPNLDGYQACRELKLDEKTKGIPVFFLTGKDLKPQGIDERCRDLDADGYFMKPYDSQELLKKIKESIAD
jgi:CheY-like chemotaxis protein